ncbi:hypothetical protein L6452_04765 [Arctium lappa]|uniref:Uncharacterized protein n=1 Tax=Arctium lappa TaxID=4217 RepID=A0ACB9EEM4_ARCLA|nr:hypothetical protein L6452_04765 [Arctium lappa]
MDLVSYLNLPLSLKLVVVKKLLLSSPTTLTAISRNIDSEPSHLRSKKTREEVSIGKTKGKKKLEKSNEGLTLHLSYPPMFDR